MQHVDRKERVLRSKVIPLVKVLWKNHEREAATWCWVIPHRLWKGLVMSL